MNSFNITTSFKFQYTIEAASKELAEEEAEKLFRKEIGETNLSDLEVELNTIQLDSIQKYDYSFSIEHENKHFNYCKKNNIPNIVISNGVSGNKDFAELDDYKYISYDLFTMKEANQITEGLAENIRNIYLNYALFFNLPEENVKIVGGRINAGLVVKTEHANFIAEALFDFLVNNRSKFL